MEFITPVASQPGDNNNPGVIGGKGNKNYDIKTFTEQDDCQVLDNNLTERKNDKASKSLIYFVSDKKACWWWIRRVKNFTEQNDCQACSVSLTESESDLLLLLTLLWKFKSSVLLNRFGYRRQGS